MNQGVVRADKLYRRKILIITLFLVLIGVVLFSGVIPWAQAYLQRLAPQKALCMVRVALVAMFLSMVPIALYLWTFGRKVLSSERFPPPDVKVIKDTRLLEGEKATFRGRLVIAFALILILLGLLGALYSSDILNRLIDRKEGTTESNPYKLQPSRDL